MGYDQAKWFRPTAIAKVNAPFAGWLVDNAAGNLISDWASPYLRNCRLDWYSITIRPGHQLFATLTAWSYPKGIWSYDRVSSSDDRIIVRHNQDTNKNLVSIDEVWAITAISTSTNIASTNRSWFTNWNDVLYHMNWSDTIGKLSGTTYSLLTAIPGSFAPAFSVIFNGSHWASGWGTNPNIVYKSVGKDYNDFTSTGSDNITMPGPVTGLWANDRTLFYFTKNTVQATDITDIIDTAWTTTYISRPIQVEEWAVNHHSIVNIWNKTFFLTPSNRIMMITRGQSVNGFETIDITGRPYKWISKLMESLDSDQSDSFWYFNSKADCIFWHFKSNWAAFNDIVVVYDLSKDRLLLDDNKHFFAATTLNWKAYAISMIEPKVFTDEDWQDDEGSPIEWEYWTKTFDAWSRTRKKVLWESRTDLELNELANCKQDIYINWNLADTVTKSWVDVIQALEGIGSSPVWENPVWEESPVSNEYVDTYILRTKGNLNVKWKTIQLRFSDSSLASKIKLTGLEMKVETLPEIATDLS